MRVIAGKCRRLNLVTPRGDATRPTTDRIKETLFNIIAPDLYDIRFLDLFSGSGGIAIEALSRGAAEAVLVENSREAIACIKENLRVTRLFDQATLMETDVYTALKRLAAKGKAFDIIFMDPPYSQGHQEKVLFELSNSPLVNNDTVIIAEALLDHDFSFVKSMGFEIIREKEYKSNKHVFIKMIPTETK